MAAMDAEGLENAAILLMSLGEDDAAEVFKHLSPKEVQGVGETISKMKSIPRERVDGVLQRFQALAAQHYSPIADTDDYVRSVLTKALGDEKANLLLDRILQNSDIAGIEGLKWMDAETISELLCNEHPQIVAAILVHLDFEHAGNILNQFTDRHRNEVMVRIATLGGIQPKALKELNDVMARLLATGDRTKKTVLGGVKPAAEMLNLMGSAAETSVLDFIRESDNELAQQITDNMFTFDDVGRIDDTGLRALLKEVQTDSLVIALKGAQAEIRDSFLRNMSSRAAETLREELETRGPVRVSEVEAEQKEILKIVRRLMDEGTINLGGGGDDEFV